MLILMLAPDSLPPRQVVMLAGNGVVSAMCDKHSLKALVEQAPKRLPSTKHECR